MKYKYPFNKFNQEFEDIFDFYNCGIDDAYLEDFLCQVLPDKEMDEWNELDFNFDEMGKLEWLQTHDKDGKLTKAFLNYIEKEMAEKAFMDSIEKEMAEDDEY